MLYFFHQIQDAGTVRDPEGSEHADLRSVENEATDSARELMAIAVRFGQDISHWRFHVVDRDGIPVLLFPFARALRRREPSTGLGLAGSAREGPVRSETLARSDTADDVAQPTPRAGGADW